MKLLRMPGRFEWKILLALFTVASLLCGLAQTTLMLQLSRGLQGIAAARSHYHGTVRPPTRRCATAASTC